MVGNRQQAGISGLLFLSYNAKRSAGFADGLIITPSHNLRQDGGVKYNTPYGGPADSDVTDWIEARANQYLQDGCAAVQRVALSAALARVEQYDYVARYIAELDRVVDLTVISQSGLKLGVDPMG